MLEKWIHYNRATGFEPLNNFKCLGRKDTILISVYINDASSPLLPLLCVSCFEARPNGLQAGISNGILDNPLVAFNVQVLSLLAENGLPSAC